MAGSQSLLGVGTLLKRVKNITKGVSSPSADGTMPAALSEPAERALWSELHTRAPAIRAAAAKGDYREAFAGIAALQPSVAKFFDDVLVMAEDAGVRAARLALVAMLRDLILDIADISEMAAETS
jgi:glycyl-tRNA synthetase beta chain